MTEDGFWKLIHAARKGAGGEDCDELAEVVTTRLAKLPPEEILAFERVYYDLRNRAYRWDLWGAAYVINGGCSDDGFEYFIAWLISRGRKVYEAALADPDSLAKVIDPDRDDYECEMLIYAPRDAYERLTGEEMPRQQFEIVSEPPGERWDEDEVDGLYPRIAAKKEG